MLAGKSSKMQSASECFILKGREGSCVKYTALLQALSCCTFILLTKDHPTDWKNRYLNGHSLYSLIRKSMSTTILEV